MGFIVGGLILYRLKKRLTGRAFEMLAMRLAVFSL